MAYIQKYFEDNKEKTYSEGPFILVKMPLDNTLYRVESQWDTKPCSGCIDMSVQKLIKEHFNQNGYGILKETEPVCDWLNKQVKKGTIIKKDGVWVVKE